MQCKHLAPGRHKIGNRARRLKQPEGAVALGALVWLLGGMPGLAQNALEQELGDTLIESYDQDDEEGGFSVILGLAAEYEPDYEGSDDYETTPLPIVVLDWNERLRFSTLEGPKLTATAFRRSGFTLDLGFGYDDGRAEDANDVLKGLGDVDGGATFQAALGYEIDTLPLAASLLFELDVESDLGGDRKGNQVGASAVYALPFAGQRGEIALGVEANWADGNYMSTMFGITERQSERSAFDLPVYDAGAGWKDSGVTLGVTYGLTESWILAGEMSYSRLMGDAVDSPLVADYGSRDQAGAKIGLLYTW